MFSFQNRNMLSFKILMFFFLNNKYTVCVCLHTDKLLWYVYTSSFVSKTASWFILDSWVFVFVSVANSVMCLLCSVRNSFLGCEVCLYNQALKQMLLISIDLSFC